MHACLLCCVCFSFSVLSQEIGWEECLQNDLFCVGWNTKTLTQSISGSQDLPADPSSPRRCLCVYVKMMERHLPLFSSTATKLLC